MKENLDIMYITRNTRHFIKQQKSVVNWSKRLTRVKSYPIVCTKTTTERETEIERAREWTRALETCTVYTVCVRLAIIFGLRSEGRMLCARDSDTCTQHTYRRYVLCTRARHMNFTQRRTHTCWAHAQSIYERTVEFKGDGCLCWRAMCARTR